jgi:hypothetical protein
LPSDSLKDILHQSEILTKTDKLLICLAVDVDRPKSIKEVKELAINAGLHETHKWNISALLSGSKGNVIRIKEGWILTSDGKKHVKKLIAPFIKPTVTKVTSSLRKHLIKIKEPNTYSFVEQAIKCFEAEFHRAAVVLSWVGAISVLYEHVRKNELEAFNKEAIRRFPKWKPANTKDDLARMKEKDFLDVLEGISIIGKSVKDELETCLKFRNGCGHPNSLQIAESRVAAHLETLMLNVFSQFRA